MSDTPTKFSDVIEAFKGALSTADEDAIEELHMAMDEYEQQFPQTMRNLRSRPAFRKFWDAMGDAEGMDRSTSRDPERC